MIVHLQNPDAGEIIVKGQHVDKETFELDRVVYAGRDVTDFVIAFDLVERIQADCVKELKAIQVEFGIEKEGKIFIR